MIDSWRARIALGLALQLLAGDCPAASIYNGLRGRPRPAAGLGGWVQLSPQPPAADRALELPGEPGLGSGPLQGPAASPLVPQTPSAGAPDAKAPPSAWEDLGLAGQRLQGPGQTGEPSPADYGRSLYDGRGGPAGPGNSFPGDAGILEFVAEAVAGFFGPLAPGERPAVALSRRSGAQAATETAPTDDEIVANVKESKKTNPERERMGIRLFEKGGARYDPARASVARLDLSRFDEVQVQEAGEPGKHNIFVVKKGRTDRVVVVSGHIDKVEIGDGVIDNWSGATTVTHLYQTMRAWDTEATYVFALFAREEEGLKGSRWFLGSATIGERRRMDANVNVDTVGVDGSYALPDFPISDGALLDRADEAVAEENRARAPGEQLQFSRLPLSGGSSDSETFMRQRPPIPGMTIYGASEAVIWDIIHSVRDTFAVFSLAHYKNCLLVVLAILKGLDRKPVRWPSPGWAYCLPPFGTLDSQGAWRGSV